MESPQNSPLGGKILIVDDDPESRRSMGRILTSSGYHVSEAGSGEQALGMLESGSFDLVILDLVMPGMNGVETCYRIRKNDGFGRIPIVFVTANNDKEFRIDGKRAGGDDFLLKPVDQIELEARVQNLMIVRRYYQHLEQDREALRRKVEEQNDRLSQAEIELKKAEDTVRRIDEEVIFRLSRVMEFRDDETGNHVQRMSRYCGHIAKNLGMSSDKCDAIRIASALHDVGKIDTPDDILRKPGRLTEEEMSVMRRHSEKGYWLLVGSSSKLIELAAIIAWSHHEKVDGNGYPRKLKGQAIPIEGRIASVADVFDALTSNRVYKAAFSIDRATSILREGRGTAFDASMLDAFFDNFDAVKNIMIVYTDR